MTDKEKASELYDLFVNHLSYQVEALQFLSSAVGVGGDEVLCFDNGRGLWITLENNAKEMKEIIEKAECIYGGDIKS